MMDLNDLGESPVTSLTLGPNARELEQLRRREQQEKESRRRQDELAAARREYETLKQTIQTRWPGGVGRLQKELETLRAGPTGRNAGQHPSVATEEHELAANVRSLTDEVAKARDSGSRERARLNIAQRAVDEARSALQNAEREHFPLADLRARMDALAIERKRVEEEMERVATVAMAEIKLRKAQEELQSTAAKTDPAIAAADSSSEQLSHQLTAAQAEWQRRVDELTAEIAASKQLDAECLAAAKRLRDLERRPY